MEWTGLCGWPWQLLLLLLWDAGFQAAGEEETQIEETQICLQEGRNLTVRCFYSRQYASSLKAWQRVRSGGPPETLIRTNTRNEDLNRAQDGRYLLEDDPSDVTFTVTVTELQRQDLGLYQCVIDLSPRDRRVLPPRFRLAQCGGPPLGLDFPRLPMLAIILTCGFVLNKGLVFSVMFVLLWKARASGQPSPGKQQSHPSGS